jgi:cell division protein FtsQ
MHQLIDKKNKIIAYLLLLLILSTTSGKFIENPKNYFSTINQINIEGLSSTDNSKIFDELNYLFYENILLIKKTEIERIINKHNIIEEYDIKKIYPSTISISIQPTKFIAKLPNNNKLVGANGKLVKNKKNSQILPYIFGHFDSQAFLNFKRSIAQSKFTFTKFKTLYLFPSNRWDVLTNDDILIKLPQDNLSESLNLAFNIISNDDFKNKKFIDLRINNHLIIK